MQLDIIFETCEVTPCWPLERVLVETPSTFHLPDPNAFIIFGSVAQCLVAPAAV